jgi:hypothetical protein
MANLMAGKGADGKATEIKNIDNKIINFNNWRF